MSVRAGGLPGVGDGSSRRRRYVHHRIEHLHDAKLFARTGRTRASGARLCPVVPPGEWTRRLPQLMRFLTWRRRPSPKRAQRVAIVAQGTTRSSAGRFSRRRSDTVAARVRRSDDAAEVSVARPPAVVIGAAGHASSRSTSSEDAERVTHSRTILLMRDDGRIAGWQTSSVRRRLCLHAVGGVDHHQRASRPR